MPTVGDSVKLLKGNRKKIYDYIEKCWFEDCYIPSLRQIARTLFIPYSTVVFHVRKLLAADLLYKIDGEDRYFLRGAYTGVDTVALCEPTETAYRKVGAQPKQPA